MRISDGSSDVCSSDLRGRPYTRNVLLDSIDSRYVAWLDAGDEWYPKKLSSQFDMLNLIESAHVERPIWITCNYDWAWVGRKKKKIAQKTEQADRKSTRLNSSHSCAYRMQTSA